MLACANIYTSTLVTWFFRALLILGLVVWPVVPRLAAQGALEIRGDQDAPEPTPIPETTTKPEPPAEPPSEEAEAKPKKKSREGPPGSVEEMSSEEFKKAGLDKLSPAELKTLNEWLKGYRRTVETKAAAEATEQTR